MYIATLKGRNFGALKVQFTFFFQNSLKFSCSLLFKVCDTLQWSHDFIYSYLRIKSRRVKMKGWFLRVINGRRILLVFSKKYGTVHAEKFG